MMKLFLKMMNSSQKETSKITTGQDIILNSLTKGKMINLDHKWTEVKMDTAMIRTLRMTLNSLDTHTSVMILIKLSSGDIIMVMDNGDTMDIINLNHMERIETAKTTNLTRDTDKLTKITGRREEIHTRNISIDCLT